MANSNTILVVMDANDDDRTALRHAQDLAKRTGASIELFSCLYDEVIENERAFESDDLIAAKIQLLQERRRELEELSEQLADSGCEVSTSATWDKPAYKGIVRRVRQIKPRLVLRNRHFHSAIQRSVFSNDDWNLIRTCPAPLMITRPRVYTHATQRIWAAVDPVHEHDKPAALDDAIMRAAQAITGTLQGTLDVLHVYDPAIALSTAAMSTVAPVALASDTIVAAVRAQHETQLHKLTDRFKIDRQRVHLRAGPPRRLIPGVMIENEADLLVIGAVARSRLKRAIIGNTAEYVLDRLPCDVLIVKPDGFKPPVRKVSRHTLQAPPALAGA